MNCPYTGELIVVDVIPAVPGKTSILFRASGCFKPTLTRFETSQAAREAMAMRDGKVVDELLMKPTDAYTGKAVTIEKDPRDGTFRVRGAFEPSQVYAEKSELVYDLSVRDGKPKEGLVRSKPKVAVKTLERPPRNPNADRERGAEIVDDSVREAVERMEAQKRGRLVLPGGGRIE